ncbi:hypothetical protein Y032_0002g557 [Ancylostoma ceylanicum]|uniref:Uncharacterized protein n=1 Tax=Ancylostoma ceylanicum TaxID=53326 RepID=A0A016VZM2_9BILA|nr:hypothetical protein Y032_0002g557 [Ancylostoma ceylanicum]
MVMSVNRSFFCRSHCSGSSVCFSRNTEPFCVCYEVDINSTDCSACTTITTNSEADEVDWRASWPILVVLIGRFFVFYLLVLVRIFFFFSS